MRIYAVNVDREEGRARQFLRGIDADLPVVWDHESRSMGLYDVMSMPTTFLVDANGTVKFRKVGYSQEKGLRELIAAIDGLRP